MRPTIDALTRDFSPAHRPLFSEFLGFHASVVVFPCPWLRSLGRGRGLNCVRDARTPDQGGQTRNEHSYIYMGFVNWVSSTGSAVRVSSQASHSPRLSRLPISKQRGENAACARQVCRKVTTRETRDQRRISTWYQNLRVLSAQSFGRQPERVSSPPINFGSVVIGGFSPRYYPPGTPLATRGLKTPVPDPATTLGRPKTDSRSPRVFASRGAYPPCGPRSLP